MEQLILGPMLVTSLVFTTPNSRAKEYAFTATYKQTGLEKIVNKELHVFVDKYLDKDTQTVVNYSYQLAQIIKNHEVSFGFTF